MNSMFGVITVQVILFLVGEAEMQIVYPTNSAEFQAALDKATGGTMITLLPKEYIGNFMIINSGTNGNPIVISGTTDQEQPSRHTIISSGKGTAFTLRGDFVNIERLTVENGDLAFDVDGNNNNLRQMLITNVRCGVNITGNQNTVAESRVDSVYGTGIFIERGEGNNVRSGQLTSLFISDQACCGTVSSTKVRDVFDVQGQRYTIQSLMVAGDSYIKGCGNSFSSDMFEGKSFVSPCNDITAPSNMFKSLRKFIVT